MNMTNMKQSGINGTADYLTANDGSERMSFSNTENLIKNDSDSPAKLVIVEPGHSDDKFDEIFQSENVNSEELPTSSNNEFSFGDAISIKSETFANQASSSLNNTSVSKLPLGRYEIAKVSKPQINLIATSLISRVQQVDNNNVNFINITKPRTTPAREAVDPAKYFVLNDEPDGTKYACSKCGNVYKWRKSLNKHWKEKHDGEAPPSLADRERMLKCPPQNFPKHSNLHVAPVLNTCIAQKSMLLPSSSVSLAGYKTSSQIRIPVNMYNLVNIHKPEAVNSRPHHVPLGHSSNLSWKSQVIKKDDYKQSEVSSPYQNSQNFYRRDNSTGSKNVCYDNSGVLDLSFKSKANESVSNDEQEEPIDFSVKPSSNECNEFDSSPSDLRKKSVTLGPESPDFTCFQCNLKFSQMFDLNSHFTCQHMNYLYEAADDFISNFESTDQKILPTQLHKYLAKGRESSLQCIICGVTENWQWKLAKHFESEHYGIEPNPYKTTSSTFYSLNCQQLSSPANSPGSSVDSNAHSTNSSSILSNHSINPEILLQKLGIPDTGVIDFDSQGTAIVIPKAPEETAMFSRNALYKHKVTEVSIFSEDGTAYILPEIPEELQSSAKGVRVSLGNKSVRGKKENSSYSSDVVLPYECKLCGYRARWPSEMTQHMKNHSDEKPYQCTQCSYRSKWKWDVVKHSKRCGGNKESSETSQKRKRSFPKAFSEVSLSDNQNETSTVWRSQSSDAPSSREILSKGPPNVTFFANERSKKKFLEGNLSPQSEKGENSSGDVAIHPAGGTDHHSNLHPCDQCHFVGHSPAELKRHLRVHSDEKPYSCKTCHYSSKWKCDLKKHLRTYNHTPAVPMNQVNQVKKISDVQGNSSCDDEKFVIDTDALCEGRLKCKECIFETFNITKLMKHLRTHVFEMLSNGRKSDDASNNSSVFNNFKDEDAKLNFFLNLGLQQTNCFDFSRSYSQEDKENFDRKINLENSSNVRLASSNFHGNNGPDLDYEHEKSLESYTSRDSCIRSPVKFHTILAADDSVPRTRESKVCPKLFTLQDVTVNNVRLKLIVKSERHFYGCIKCPYVSCSAFRAVYHSRQHGSRRNFKCFFCDYASDQVTFVCKHEVSWHGEENNNNLKRSNVTKTKKTKHFRILPSMNLNVKQNLCISCGFASLNRASILKHRLTRPCSQLLVRNFIHNVFSCNFCSYKTDEKLVLVDHLKGHGSSFKYNCLRCDFSSNLSNVILNHEKNQHRVC